MKKYIYYLMALAALTVVSCQQAEKPAEEEETEGSVQFSVNPTCVVPAEGAEEIELSVISNVPFEPVLEEVEWLHLVVDAKAETARSSFKISVDPQPYNDSESRSAVITFKNTETLELIETKMSVLTVIQKDSKGLAITISKQPGVIDFNGAYLDDDDALEVSYKSNIPIAVYIPELKEGATAKEQEEYEEAYGWIHFVEEESEYDEEKGEGTFVIEVYENEGTKARSVELGIIRLDKEFDKVEDAIVEGKTIKITQEGRVSQMLFVVDGQAADGVGEIVSPAGGNASFTFAASCPVEPYFAEGGELEYTITPGEMFSTISFKVPANTAEEAAHYTIYFKDVTEPEKEETAKSVRATKEVSLLRNIYTGELVSVNFLVLAELKGFVLEETDPFELEYGGSVALHPVFTPEGAAEGREIEWASSDDDILSVEDGLVTAVGVGDATITATVEGFAPSVDITVPWAVSFDEEEIELEFAGDPITLTPVFLPAEAGEGATLEWSSSDEDVATVDNGVVTPINTGVTTITVTVGEKSASIDVIVVPQILYGEDFESFTGDGWGIYDADGDGNNWSVWTLNESSNIPVYSGSHALISFSWNGSALTPDNYIWTPEIQLKDSDNYLDFQIGTNPYYPDYYAAYIMDDEGMTPVSYGWVSPADGEYFVRVTVPIPDEFAGEAVSVLFRHFNCTDMNYLLVDDVFVTYGDPTGFELEVPAADEEVAVAPSVSKKFAGKNVSMGNIQSLTTAYRKN